MATIPRSDAMASPTVENLWNSAEYTGMDATVIRLLATMGTSVFPAA